MIFDVKLNAVESLPSRRLVTNVVTLNYILEHPFKQLRVGASHMSALHLLFQLVTEDAIKLVDIVLHIHFSLTPPKSVKQLESSHRFFACLKIVENSLKTEGNAFEIVNISGHLVHCSPERSYYVQRLEETVDVAGRPLIDYTIVLVLYRLYQRSSASLREPLRRLFRLKKHLRLNG